MRVFIIVVVALDFILQLFICCLMLSQGLIIKTKPLNVILVRFRGIFGQVYLRYLAKH